MAASGCRSPDEQALQGGEELLAVQPREAQPQLCGAITVDSLGGHLPDSLVGPRMLLCMHYMMSAIIAATFGALQLHGDAWKATQAWQ